MLTGAPENAQVVFLLDVDNTLFENDRFVADLTTRLDHDFGRQERERYWTLHTAVRDQVGYADYLAALQGFRADAHDEPALLRMSAFLLDYPFSDRLYPHALEVVEHLGTLGTTAILSDGDIVFQPRKIQRSGLWAAVDGRVLVTVHKEQRLDLVSARFPASHYVMIGDKPRVLAAMKRALAARLTTVFVRQGRYATESKGLTIDPAPDLTVRRIGDLRALGLSEFRPAPAIRNGKANHQPATERTHEEAAMKPTLRLHDLGQSLWLDNITRDMLDSGTLRRYVDELSITGVTSNPTIFEGAITNGDTYDECIREKTRAGKSGRELFVELALEDLRRAADLLRPVFESSGHVDGWVSMEVSPTLAGDTQGSIEAARWIHRQADRPNVFVKIPGTPEGLPAIEASIFAGVPVNVTLLFSREQYLAAAEAYERAIERRLQAGLDPHVASVASVFVSRWDVAVGDKVPTELRNRLGLAISGRAYRAYRERLASPRWLELADAGARPQRLLWASTGTKDPEASDTLYVEALAAPDTIDTMPEKTLHALAEHGSITGVMAVDGGDAEAMLGRFAQAGVDVQALARQLQREGARSFVDSWQQLLRCIAEKSVAIAGP